MIDLTDADAREDAATAVAARFGARRFAMFVRHSDDAAFVAARGFESVPLTADLQRLLGQAAMAGTAGIDDVAAVRVDPLSVVVFTGARSGHIGLDEHDFELLTVLAALFRHELGAETSHRISNRQVRNVLESITDAFFLLDHEWRFAYVNRTGLRMLQREADELVGRNIWAEYPEAIGRRFHIAYREAMENRTTIEFEEYYPPPLDTWYSVRAFPTPDGLSVYFRDIGERRKLEEHVRNVSTPILDIGDRVLLVPLIGMFDTQRAAQLEDRLLEAIRFHRARAAVIDVTGLALIDAQIVRRLNIALRGANLLGCETITVGVTADIARELVRIGGTPADLRTCIDLQTGVELARGLGQQHAVRVRAEPVVPTRPRDGSRPRA